MITLEGTRSRPTMLIAGNSLILSFWIGRLMLSIRFSKTDGQVVFVQQCWHLEPGGHQGNLVIAKRGYPIERSGTTIKLGINDDLDEYYEKVR